MTQGQKSRGGWLERRRETQREKRQKRAPRGARTSVIILSVALVTAAAELKLREDDDEGFSAAQAKAAALSWVGTGQAQAPRRDGEDWEVDVVRPDGSLVQVTLGDSLELRGFDEEFGPVTRPGPTSSGERPAPGRSRPRTRT